MTEFEEAPVKHLVVIAQAEDFSTFEWKASGTLFISSCGPYVHNPEARDRQLRRMLMGRPEEESAAWFVPSAEAPQRILKSPQYKEKGKLASEAPRTKPDKV